MRPWQRRVATPYVAVLDKEDTRIVNAIPELTAHADRSLLIVEDDKPFLERLSRAMETRGFTVTSCDTVSDGLAQIGRAAPAFAVVDLRLGDGAAGTADDRARRAGHCMRLRAGFLLSAAAVGRR